MDFEVEDDPYQFDWNENSKKSSKASKGKASYFGGNDNEEDEYTYDYNKNKKPSGLSQFSPPPATGKHGAGKQNVVVVDSSNALDKAKSMLSKYTAGNKPVVSAPISNFKKTAKTFDEDDLSIGSNEFSDMGISDSEDFNHKTLTKTKSAPLPKKGKRDVNELGAPEAVVTVSMGDDESDGDYDDTRDFLNKSNLSDSAQKGDFEDDSEHDNYSNEDFDVDDRLAAKGLSAMTFDTDLGESTEGLEHTADESGDAGTSKSNNDFEIENDTNDDFDIINNNDDDDDGVENASYSRMAYGTGDDDYEVEESVEDRDDNNDEIEDDMEVSNKPIILSFADLAAIPSWEQTSMDNGAVEASQAEVEESVDDIEESIIEVPKSSKSAPVKRVASESSEDDDYDDDEYVDESEESKGEVSPPPAAAPVTLTAAASSVSITSTVKTVQLNQPVISAAIVQPKPTVIVPTKTIDPVPATAKSVLTKPTPKTIDPPAATQPVTIAAPTVVVPVQPVVAPQVASVPSAAAPPVAASAPPPSYAYAPPPQGLPGSVPYYGYPYGQPPPPAPSQGPHDPAHSAAAPQMPYMHPAYPYYPPMMMSPYGMYPSPHMMSPYGMQPPPPPQYDPRMSFAMGQNPFSPFQYPQQSQQQQHQPNMLSSLGNNASSSQPLVLDLLQELRRTKEEAEWAKQKLAETMLFVRDQEISAERLRKSADNLPSKNTGSPRSTKTRVVEATKQFEEPIKPAVVPVDSKKNRYSDNRSLYESIDEVNESDILDDNDNNDYSDDFEESHLNLSTYSAAGRLTPSKGSKHVTMSSEVAAVAPSHSNVQQHHQQSIPTKSRVAPTVTETPSVWNLERPTYVSKDTVVDPLKQSLAHSLLSSQELFRNQIDSLKLRLSMANASSSVTERHWEATRSSLPASYTPSYHSSTFKPAASLADLKQEFAKKRLDDTRRLYEVLTRVYPDLDEGEAIHIAGKFQS